MHRRSYFSEKACAIFLAVALLSPSARIFALRHVTPVEGYRIVRSFPHDPTAFTQGLVYVDGMLFEGTGLRGQSSIRREDLTTGRVLREHRLPPQYFGEGLTDWGNRLIELTWQSHIGFVYDRSSFRLLRTFPVAWEGWGLTHDSKHLILSDGSSVLHLLDPVTFQPVGKISVTDNGKPVMNLNELEYIHGEIYANIWQTNRIARIAPTTGKVVEWINLTGLRPFSTEGNDNAVLNGIAYDRQHNRLFVTGKLWPRIFEIQLVPSKPSVE